MYSLCDVKVILKEKIYGHIIFMFLSPNIFHLFVFEVAQSDTSNLAVFCI